MEKEIPTIHFKQVEFSQCQKKKPESEITNEEEEEEKKNDFQYKGNFVKL